MELSSSEVKRLSFIKYLYHLGINQSSKPEQLASAALLTFHDSAELFLRLASEHLDEGKSHMNFMDYWEKLSHKLPEDKTLAQKESMRRLNDARVNLKHSGNHPSKTDLEGYRAVITNFFQDNCPIVFGISFDSISMINFVEPEEARQKLERAKKLNSDDKIDEAIDEIAIAFEIMLDDYEERKQDFFSESPFDFIEDLRIIPERGKDRRFQRKIVRSLKSMEEVIKILAFGIDYKKYSRFKILTPNVGMVTGGEDGLEYMVMGRKEHELNEEANSEDVKFCINFTIEAALKLQEFDYELKSPKHANN